MSFSNYPMGFPGGVLIRGMPILQTNPGKVFWVSNNTTGLLPGQRGGSDGNRGDFNSPFATLDAAISACASGRGDIIFIKPGHAETISANTALNFDVAGVAIVGLGTGSSRPTFTLDTANTNRIPVSAANISIKNCIFIGNFLSIATCFLLTTAPDFEVDACAFRDTDATHGFLTIITTTVAVVADGLRFTNNSVTSKATTSPGPAISILGTHDRLTVDDNEIWHTVANNNVALLIEHAALVVTRLMCRRNFIYCVNTDSATGAIIVKTTATTGSGMIAHNRVKALDTAAAILVPAAAIQYAMFDNLYIGEASSVSGFVLPAIDTDA
jgi:hypothetical protein